MSTVRPGQAGSVVRQTTFKFKARGVSFELSGPETFVRAHLSPLMPLVHTVLQSSPAATPPGAHATSSAPASGATQEQATSTGGATAGLTEWLAQHAAAAAKLTMQDHILVFALWMRTFKKYIFTSEDIRRGFAEVGVPEPKSLLQILGTLKRDHNLILGTERRGEYMLNTTGIERARSVLGIRDVSATRRPSAPAAPRPRSDGGDGPSIFDF